MEGRVIQHTARCLFAPTVATAGAHIGVEIVGTGQYLPEGTITNHDLSKLMDTNDEWIVQRTGIHKRHRADLANGETTKTIASKALKAALANAKVLPSEVDLLICATMTPEMTCPASSNLIANEVGIGYAGSFDLVAACSGFVYGLNVAHDLIRGRAYRTIAVVGADTLTKLMDYTNAGRGTAILFGDGAGAAILRATSDNSKGILAQAMHSDGTGWKDIYVPNTPHDFPSGTVCDPTKYGHVQMNGSGVFKFAVGTFCELIQQTLDKAKLQASDIDMFVCHQSNSRILQSARERFGLPEDKLYVNIDRVGNTVGASVPLCLDDLRQAGRIKPGMKVLFLAFGGGLTWASSLWQM
jgi:3-oxoacyl-[acyl-carrier-protein] synthase-3